MKNLPNLADLKVFYEVALNRSFGKSAEELGTSPAYISKRIHILEQTLNCKLFHRNTRHVSLTDNGKLILDKVAELLGCYDDISDLLTSTAEHPSGHLDIVCSFGFGRKHIAPILSELLQIHPGLSVNFDLLDNTRNLIEHSIDLDIRIGNDIAHNMIARKLMSNFRILCASPAYLQHYGQPESIHDLKNYHYLGISERDQASVVLKLKSRTDESITHIEPHFISNNGEIIRQLALDGKGIILRSIWDVAEDLKTGKLQHILTDYWQDADIWAVYPSRLQSSSRLQVCIEFIREQLQNRLEPLTGIKPGTPIP
ncbi:LysR family transcriptional regulator [Acinetobacter sp. WCHAc010052]|uniref:LysR family transcriptional regulator n=1 Tax=Acinetobacter sp. WCHAc010052 TaxID=2004647 RepID=UPI000B3C3568|nr:LysR family transcriptional regulator [Acinetobacter sp. WCHAc010052]AXY59673.1 LysR family transcriptional regulator [Acinetobacter sp. WCHAc010052]